MNWLKKLVDKKLAELPKDAFVDRTYGFADFRSLVDLLERTIKSNAATTMEANRASLLAAARDPFSDGKGHATFRSMATDFWQTGVTFPRIARNALLIATYSHTEYLLLSWCVSASPEPEPAKKLRAKPKSETTPHWYLRYLRDTVGIKLGDFTKWPEWEAIDGYRLARNCLAHNGGVVDRPSDAPKIASLPHVTVDQSRLLANEPVVHLLPGACEAAIDTANAFIGRAVTSLESMDDECL